MLKKLQLALVASAIAVLGSSVHAASDGLLAGTSTGTSVVTIIKDNSVQISNVDDLNMLAHATLTADESASDEVCVFSSTTGYTVTVTSSTGTFDLLGASPTAPETLPFALTWAEAGQPAVTLGHNATSPAMSGDNSSLTCGTALTNAAFEATVAATDFNAAAPDTYSATLTILVAPQ